MEPSSATRPGSRYATLLRLVRFAITGGIASGVYVVVSLIGMDLLDLSAFASSVFAYLVAIPVSYAGQKLWTFRATGSVASELPRFLLVQLANLAAAAALMAVLVDLLGFHRFIGIGAVVIAIPAATYLLLSRGVFTQRDPR